MQWPIPSFTKMVSSYIGSRNSLSPPPTQKIIFTSPPANKNYSPPSQRMITSPLPHNQVGMACLQPSSYRSPTSITQRMYQQYITKQHLHKAEMVRPSPCYVRNFPSPVTPPQHPKDKFIFPERVDCGSSKMVMDGIELTKKGKLPYLIKMKSEPRKESDDILGFMLAELREGTEEMNL